MGILKMKHVFQISPVSTPPERNKQWPQFLAVLTACLLAIGSGFQNAWPSPSVPKLLSNDLGFEVSAEESSYVVAISPLGFLVGSPLAGALLDKIGRKNTLLFLAIPEIIPWILIGTSSNVPVLYVARFIKGIADGALFTSLPIYMCEILEPKIRGIVGTSHSLGIIIGGLLMNVYGSFVSIREAAWISLIAPLLFLLTFVWMPDSPYYLMMKERTEDARKSLQRLRRVQRVDEELLQITTDVRRQVSESGTLKDIFIIKSNLKAFLMLICLRTVQQFSGVIALNFYMQVIFKQANGSLTPAESAIICCAIQVMVTACGALVVDKFGRIPILLVSSVGTAVILLALGTYFYFQRLEYDLSSFLWFPIVGMVLFNVVGAFGLIMIPNLMAGELLSASIKSKGLGIINMYLGVCVSIASKLFQWLDHDFGMHVPFFVFGACCIIGSVFIYCFVLETKGKTLEQIQQQLKGNVSSESEKNSEKIDKEQERY